MRTSLSTTTPALGADFPARIRRLPGTQGGLSLIDMLVVVVIVAIIGAYAVMRMHTAGENTFWYQAQRLARDIRHVQVLTSTWGRPLQLTAVPGTNGSYSVSCVTSGAAPCDVSPIIDPATGDPFNVTLQHDVALGVSGGSTIQFDTQGRPLPVATATAKTFTVSAGGSIASVVVQPITGYVAVTP